MWPGNSTKLLFSLLPLLFPAFLPAQARPPLFQPMGKFPIPFSDCPGWDMAVGDVNGDGRPDLLEYSYRHDPSDHTVFLFLNRGHAIFDLAPPGAIQGIPQDSILSALFLDVDRDQDMDLVAVMDKRLNTTSEDYLAVFLNDGKGRFLFSRKYPAPNAFLTACSGDLDGDGDPDLLVFTWMTQKDIRPLIFINNGKGLFSEEGAGRIPLCKSPSGSGILGDFDGDGDLDLVVGSMKRDQLFLNDGKGRFTEDPAFSGAAPSWPSSVFFAQDMDKDGDLDIFAGDWEKGFFFLNDGKGRFRLFSREARGLSKGAALFMDVDGDGDPDAVTRYKDDILYLNDGKGYFRKAPSSSLLKRGPDSYGVTGADLDGDGDGDLVFTSPFWPNLLFLGDGKGKFLEAEALAWNAPNNRERINQITGADLNGDGRTDILEAAQHIRWYANSGMGTFPSPPRTIAPHKGFYPWIRFGLGDLDRDGDLDLVAYSNFPRLFRNDGKGNFTETTKTAFSNYLREWTDLALVDWDRDGDLDLVYVNFQGIFLLLNDGKARFLTGKTLFTPSKSSFKRIFLFDLDGDGDEDILAGIVPPNGWTPPEPPHLLVNRGGKLVDETTRRLPELADPVLDAAAGDLDGDGDGDLVILLMNYGTRIWLNDGKGFFKKASNRLPGRPLFEDSGWAVALGDVDGDGDLDMAMAQFQRRTTSGFPHNRILLNDGKGFFRDATDDALGHESQAVALSDLDGDGDLDLLLGGYSDPITMGTPTRVFFNLTRQVNAPWPARPGLFWRMDVYAGSPRGKTTPLVLPLLSAAKTRACLPPFGRLLADPAKGVVLGPLFVSPKTGVRRVPLRVPKDPALLGALFYLQALVVPDLNWPPSTWRFTNALQDRAEAF